MRDLLTDPYGWALLSLAGALVTWSVLRWRGRRTLAQRVPLALLGFALAELLVCGLPFVADRLAAPLEAACDAPAPFDGPPEAIVLLGAGVANSRVPWSPLGSAGTARVAETLAAALRWPEAVVVVSGERGHVTRASGGQRMLEELQRMGLPPERIVFEDRARTTRGNAVHVARWAAEHGVRRLAVVTSAVHMPRALGAFRERGFEPLPVCAERSTWPGIGSEGLLPEASAFERSTAALHEHFGLLWYRFRGYL